MKSNESIRCSNSIICGDSTVCGKYTLNDDMQVFFVNNVGILNSGWMPTGDTSTGYEYLYVNVENVTSSTLNITRIKNDIIVDIPDEYGRKLDFNASTGRLSLIGQGTTVLSTVQLSNGLALTDIVEDPVLHTITFKFNNAEDKVVDLVKVLGDALTIEGITDNKISTNKENKDAILKVDEGNAFVSGPQGDLPLYPDLGITSDTTITLRNNMERVLEGTTTSAIFKLEKEDASLQGFCAVVVFTTGTSPHITFDNQSGKTIVYIKENQKFQEITGLLSPRYQYNLFVLCNGINIEVYIQEIAI